MKLNAHLGDFEVVGSNVAFFTQEEVDSIFRKARMDAEVAYFESLKIQASKKHIGTTAAELLEILDSYDESMPVDLAIGSISQNFGENTRQVILVRGARPKSLEDFKNELCHLADPDHIVCITNNYLVCAVTKSMVKVKEYLTLE